MPSRSFPRQVRTKGIVESLWLDVPNNTARIFFTVDMLPPVAQDPATRAIFQLERRKDATMQPRPLFTQAITGHANITLPLVVSIPTINLVLHEDGEQVTLANWQIRVVCIVLSDTLDVGGVLEARTVDLSQLTTIRNKFLERDTVQQEFNAMLQEMTTLIESSVN